MESTINNTKLNILFFIIFILFNTVTGSCLSYGHSCWGAHGKRSNVNQIDNNGGIDQKSIEWFLSKLDRLMVKPNDGLTPDDYHKLKTLRRNFEADEKLNNLDDTSIISEPFLVKDILRDETHALDILSNQKVNDEKFAIGPATTVEEVLIDRLNKRKHQDRKQNWQVLRSNGEPSILISEDDVIRNYT